MTGWCGNSKTQAFRHFAVRTMNCRKAPASVRQSPSCTTEGGKVTQEGTQVPSSRGNCLGLWLSRRSRPALKGTTSRAPRCLTCSILRRIQLTWATKCGHSLLHSRGWKIQITIGLLCAETRGWALLCLRITAPPMIPVNTREASLVFSREGIWCLPSRIQESHSHKAVALDNADSTVMYQCFFLAGPEVSHPSQGD